MPIEELHVGDVGVIFTFTFYEKDGVTAVNLTGATTVEVKLEKRGGAGVTWIVTVTDAPNGVGTYTTIAGDLDVHGTWKVMGHVDVSTTDTHFKQDTFKVLPVLAGA